MVFPQIVQIIKTHGRIKNRRVYFLAEPVPVVIVSHAAEDFVLGHAALLAVNRFSNQLSKLGFSKAKKVGEGFAIGYVGGNGKTGCQRIQRYFRHARDKYFGDDIVVFGRRFEPSIKILDETVRSSDFPEFLGIIREHIIGRLIVFINRDVNASAHFARQQVEEMRQIQRW